MMVTPSRSLLTGLLTIAVVTLTAGRVVLSAPQAVGTAVLVRGTWLVDGSAVAEGAAVPPSGRLTLRRAGNAAGSVIEIVYAGAGSLAPFTCRATDPCSAGYTLPRAAKPDSFGNMLLRLAQLVSPGRVPLFALSRGIGPSLRDGVVGRNGDVLVLGDSFAAISPGAYSLTITRWGDPDSPKAVATMRISVRKATPVTVRLAGARDGLYGLSLSDKEGPVGDDALVAVTSASDYAARRKAYQKAVALTRTWPPKGNEVAGTFLRRILVGLANPNWAASE